MKRLFLLFSLFFMSQLHTSENKINTVIKDVEKMFSGDRTTTLKKRPALATKPKRLQSTPKERVKEDLRTKPKLNTVAAVVAAQKVKPQVVPRALRTRNLVIIVNDSIAPTLQEDPLTRDLARVLAAPSPNYTILLSAEVLKSFLNTIQFVSHLVNPSISAEALISHYKEASTPYSYDIKSYKKHFTNHPQAIDLHKLQHQENLLDLVHTSLTFNLFDRWTIAKTIANFYVLVPKYQLLGFPFSQEHFSEQQNLRTFIDRSPHIETTENQSFQDFGARFSVATSILLKKQPGKIPLPLNIMMDGHGSIDQAVAGIPLDTFKYFVTNRLSKTNTHSLYYSSCYAGGRNSVTVFDREFPFIVIAQGINEATIDGSGSSKFTLSSYFKDINSNFQKALDALRDKSTDPSAELLQNDFKVRLPGTDWFTPVEAHRKLQIISGIQARTAFLEEEPIQLKGTTCGLSTPVLPTLETQPSSLFSGSDTNKQIIGLVPFKNPEQEFYTIKKLVIYVSKSFSDSVAQLLHTRFYTFDKRSSTFFIEELKFKNTSYFNVIISKNYIAFCERQEAPPNFYTVPNNELKEAKVTPLHKPQKREIEWHTQITQRAQIAFDRYEDKIKEYKKLHKRKHHRPHSLFAHLKHRLHTEDLSAELERYANETLKGLSDAEQMIIKSVIAAKKDL